MRLLLAPLFLAACVAPAAQDHYDCNCVEIPSDDQSIADSGFPNDSIYMLDGYATPDANGLTHLAVQFDTTQATAAMISASPAALCKAADLTLVSSQVVPPGPDDSNIPGSMIVKAICK
jgi:hypothetical protein